MQTCMLMALPGQLDSPEPCKRVLSKNHEVILTSTASFASFCWDAKTRHV